MAPMSEPRPADLIYDWNECEVPDFEIQFDDETLRDGLQSPSARDPELGEKIELVHLMDELGIDTADVGLPGASPRAREHILALCREMKDLAITPNVACRTMVSDIAPAAEIQQAVGSPVEVCTFIGSSPIRQYAEGWDLKDMLKLVRDAIGFCTREGLRSMFVTEDTTRAHPDAVRALYTAAIEAGANRICICDTCGHAQPSGVDKLVRFVKDLVAELGADVGIDWHGHRDRGLGLINAIIAIEAGATRIHGTAMGVGERTGNTEMDLLLANLKLSGWIDRDLTRLGDYVRAAARAGRSAGAGELPDLRQGCLRDLDRGARRGGDQGLPQGGRVAREPRVLGRPGRSLRAGASDRRRADVGTLERHLGAREAPRGADRRARQARPGKSEGDAPAADRFRGDRGRRMSLGAARNPRARAAPGPGALAG